MRPGHAVEIVYLADCLAFAPLLAEWHWREWGDLLPGWTREQAEDELKTHTGRCRIPTTFVALEGGHAVGSASLVESDLPGWEHLSPWLASVFVVPACRGHGLGRQLVRRAIDDALALGVTTLYLYTAGQAGYYRQLGWEPWQRTEHHDRGIDVMRYAVSGEG